MAHADIDVAVVGDNTIDRFPDEPSVGDLVGGNALNVAVHLAMLGVRVGYFGAVGTDASGDLVRKAAEDRGVEISGLVSMAGSTALTTIRRDPGGDRRFESEDFGVSVQYYPSAADVGQIAAASWVHVGMFPQSRLLGEYLARASRAAISQDCSVSPESHRLDVHFVSAGEDDAIAERIVGEALKGANDIVVATLGAGGALAGRLQERWRVPSAPTRVVDTTGAGDSFMAGFIASRLSGGSIEDALQAGVARGAFTCQYIGGWPQLPDDVRRYG